MNQGVAFPSTHDLNVLILLLPDGLAELQHSHDIPELNIYSTQRRYEEGPTPAISEDASQAESMAAAVFAWARNICK